MRISRLYITDPLQVGTSLKLDPDSSHYLKTVLRLKRGYELVLFNGDGADYAAIVGELGRDGVRVDIRSRSERNLESPLDIHLGLGISRGERMDFAVQKAVELGVARITPLFTEHCVVRLEPDRQDTRHQHWRKVAQSAAEQCGRTRLPEVAPPVDLETWVGGQCGLRLFFDPAGNVTLRDLPAPDRAVAILSGPEGGFAERERALARSAGFLPVRLGPRILRAETAVLAALAVVQARWGDF